MLEVAKDLGDLGEGGKGAACRRFVGAAYSPLCSSWLVLFPFLFLRFSK